MMCEELEVHDHIPGADLLVTGEGFVDVNSFEGKVVGGVCGLGAEHKKPVLIVCGDYDDGIDLPTDTQIVSIKRMFGEEQAMTQTLTCIERAVATALSN